MTDEDSSGDVDSIVEHVRTLAATQRVRITQHAHQEMVEDAVTLDELLDALRAPRVLENYPHHQRGACCLVLGWTFDRRPLHVVCTTAQPLLVIITVYEPTPPKWISPTQRSQGQ